MPFCFVCFETINVGGSASTVTGAVYDTGTNGITFTIDSAVGFGQNVTISYDSGSGTIVDLANHPSPDFTETIINHVGKIVSFDSNGGSSIGFVRASTGSTIAAPTTPTKTGNTFVGWYKEPSLTNAWDFETDIVTANVTLYAKWVFTLTPQLELGDISGNAGATIDVPLTLTNGVDIAAIEFDLTFDSEFLTLLTDSGDIANITYNYIADGDYYRVLIGNADNDIIPEAIGHLQFTIADDETYQETATVTLSHIIVSDPDETTAVVAEDSATITVSDTLDPTISLTPSTTDYATSVAVTVNSDGTGSSIVGQKWAEGDVDLSAFESGGTVFTGTSLPITANGTYTVYVEDEAGNGTIATINVNNFVVKGDANNVDGQYIVDITDWQTVANFILLKEVPDDRQKFAADMNNDDSINVGDWVGIANKLIE